MHARLQVEETSGGWTLSAMVPGLNVKQLAVTVETTSDGARHLHLSAKARKSPPSAAGGAVAASSPPSEAPTIFSRSWLLEEEADAAAIKASCLDGVLRVVVPRSSPHVHKVAVASLHPEDADDEGSEDGYLVVERVPGVRASDVAAEIITKGASGPAVLNVNASRPRYGVALVRSYQLPPDADVRAEGGVKASCADGLLRIVIKRSIPASAPLKVATAPDKNAKVGRLFVGFELSTPMGIYISFDLIPPYLYFR